MGLYKNEANWNRNKQFDTLFNTQTQKMAPYSRKKQKLRIVWTVQLYSLFSVTLEVKRQVKLSTFTHGNFSWCSVCTLSSKDYTRNKKSNANRGKNDTLLY